MLRSARNWARTYQPDGESSEIEIEVAKELTDAVENQFKRLTRAMGEDPSIARLNILVRALPYGSAFDAARKAGVHKVRLDAELIPHQWQS